MKTQYILSTIIALFIASFSFAQTSVKTDTIAVNGNCGMCKKNIETAAKSAGAAYALWNKDSKQLIVKYAGNTSSSAKIEQAVAAKGYDTKNVKASDAAYKKLDECCQYDRTVSFAVEKQTVKNCCDKNEICDKTVCNASTNMSCCKNDATKHNCYKNPTNSCCSKTNK